MNKELSKGLLLNEQGDLNEAGFSLSLIKEYQRSQIHGLKWRIKEWDYYYIGNQDYGLCLTISDVSFLALISVTFLDFKSNLQPAKTILKPFTFGKVGLPSSSKEGDVSFKNKQTKTIISLFNLARRCLFLDFHRISHHSLRRFLILVLSFYLFLANFQYKNDNWDIIIVNFLIYYQS